jgi:cholinesterase
MNSGTSTSFFGKGERDNSEVFLKAAASLGCEEPRFSRNGWADVIDCMRRQSTADLLNVTNALTNYVSILGNFIPTPDDRTVFPDYVKRGNAGDLSSIPLLIGENDSEVDLFRIIIQVLPLSLPSIAYRLFNLDIFTCPTANSARWRHRKNGHLYRYRYAGSWPNVKINKDFDQAWHGAELPVLFQTTETVSRSPDTEDQRRSSRYLRAIWSSFAKDPKSLTKSPFNFPTYSPNSKFPLLIELCRYLTCM